MFSQFFGRQFSKQRSPRSFTDFMYLRRHRLEPGFKKINKFEVAALAGNLGLPTPATYRRFDSADSIDLVGLPSTFVLKPHASKRRRGVLLLSSLEDGRYHDAMSDRMLSVDDIRALEKEVARDQTAQLPKRERLQFLAEERVVHESGPDNLIPFDYKIYTFHGDVQVIVQIDRNHPEPELAFFGGDFLPRHDLAIVGSSGRRGHPKRPQHAEEMLDIARSVSIAMSTPFLRVDCYSTTRGAVLGEITQTPGGPWYGRLYSFSRETELRLGSAYREAYGRLEMTIASVPMEYIVTLQSRPTRRVGSKGLTTKVFRNSAAQRDRLVAKRG